MPFKIVTDKDEKIEFICWFNENIVYNSEICPCCGKDIMLGEYGIIFEVVDIRRPNNTKNGNIFNVSHIDCFGLSLKIVISKMIQEMLDAK